jgi:PAS domain S-box-containing protein
MAHTFDESARLASLWALDALDTPQDPELDRITDLAADLFDAPIALISLVDDTRQWFKSRRGLEIAETPRDHAFCAHALQIGPEDVLVVPDARTDRRFCANPLVTGPPEIRFYAGAPMIAADGHVMGTLCVLDTAPRPHPDGRTLARLRKLSAAAMDTLRLLATARTADARAGVLDLAGQMSQVGYWSVDFRTGKVIWSDAVYAIHGLDPDAYAPSLRSAIEFYHPEDRDTVRGYLERVATGAKETVQRRLRLLRSDGEARIVMCRARLNRDDAGAPAALFGVLQDVTDQIDAAERIQRSESRHRLLADHMADVVTSLAPDGSSRYISPTVETLLGYRPAEMAGRGALDFVHAPDRLLLAEALKGLGAQARSVRVRAVRKDASLVWVEASLRAVADTDGSQIVAVIRDITAQRELEEAIAQSEARYRRLADNASDILACFDTTGRFTYLSPSIESVLGYAPESLIGRRTRDLMHPEDYKRSLATYTAHVASARPYEPFTFEYRAFHKDGRTVWLAAHPRAILDEAGQVSGFQDVIRDISERKAAEEALVLAKLEAEAAASAKADFLATMSHELRTPLTSIIGFARLAAEAPDLPDEAATYVARVGAGARALLTTVNDLLDFSKLEAGRFEVVPRPTPVAVLAREALELFTPQADAKRLELALDVAPECAEVMLSLDPDRVRQVLLNLLGNAVKFTSAGVVRLRLHRPPPQRRLRVEIVDTGQGVAPDKIHRLFQRFSQIDGELTRGQTGTGLGLAICKGLIEAMGGEIGVRSEVGRGSCFWFELPFIVAAPADDAEPESAPTASLDGLRVLVADDHPANREFVRLVLGAAGIEVFEAADGESAADLAAREPLDALLLDLRMPRLGGLVAMQRIRADGGRNAAQPMLAFTADAGEALVSHLLAAGFDGVVSKPAEPAALLAAIAAAARAGGLDEQTRRLHATEQAVA